MSEILVPSCLVQLREMRDTLERLEGVMKAIDDVQDVDFEEGERHELRVTVEDTKERPVAFSYNLPPETILIGLRAMRDSLAAKVQGDDLSRAVSHRQEFREVLR